MSNKPKRRPSHANRIQAAADERKRRTGLIIGVVAGAVVLALVIALLARRDTSQVTSGGGAASGNAGTVVSGQLSNGDVKVQGSSLPKLAGDPDKAVGMTAPILTGEQFNEKPITMPTSGRPAVIMFLAHWCPHCQAEVPRIVEELQANGMPSDVDLFTVATGISAQKPNFPPADWLRRAEWPVPTLVDDEQGTAATAYGLSGFPYFVVVGADGKVIQRLSGELADGQFDELIAAAGTGSGATTGTAGPSSPR